MSNSPAFANSQYHPGTNIARSTGNVFAWRLDPVAPAKTKIDGRKPGSRKYSDRFATVEAYEQHKAASRIYDKKRRAKLALARMAINNPPADVLVHDSKATTGQAGYAFRTV